MEEKEFNEFNERNEIFSIKVRAGKRTYFFDVKSTKEGEFYLSVCESKRRFDNGTGEFYFQKHKIFLYPEDFEKFRRGLDESIHFINTGEKPLSLDDESIVETESEFNSDFGKETELKSEFTDLDFDELSSSKTEN
jgi:hypothetical protein